MKNTREMMRKILYTILYSLAHNTLKLQILLTLKKNFTSNRSIHHPSLKCSKKYPSSSTIFEQLNFQFVTSLSLSLPQIHSTQPLYPPIFIHPFNERRSKFQASHPRISFDRELKGIDWITPKAPSWFSTSFDFSNRNRTSEEICRFPDFTFPFSAQHPANWMLKSKFFPKRTRKDGGLNEVKKVGEFPEIL